ncbi:hypothetical protein CA13_43730 [Planctomycetes bacterium CA13]|uniref:BIG2 domain-containing protein n=1 Tax=Novipirellula herctigrandis TaxID=2527986 RepID=A0A5C5Z6U0_9BACT|nr:hypothetical protein CA13_43730 [Planctomycetes bacterium CA13]
MIRIGTKPTFCIVVAMCVLLLGQLGAPVSAEPAKISTPKPTDTNTKTLAPLRERFQSADVTEAPDFQKHVVPLLGRLGCNGRACHGSFQGRGGFQLSLFGYDFKSDHAALHEENCGRVDVDDIDESLILVKPLDADMHDGGKRFDKGSWQHHVLRKWIASGAEFNPNKMHLLEKLEVIPTEISFSKQRETVQLTATAHWQDGTMEDVTQLCRFSTNDESIAAIDELGEVTSGEKGDTHVVVYYDNAVVPIPVLRPIGPKRYAASEATTAIDRLVLEKLDKLGVAPSDVCTDAEFLRRVSLDMTGVLPAADFVREFLADTSPNKRATLVDELLDSPAYAAWWATRMSDWTGNSDAQLNNALPVRGAASRLWHEWLRVRIDQNMPYDQIVQGIVEAKSRQEGESYLEYCEAMTEACQRGNENLFAERDGLPLYWARRNFQKPEDRAIGFAYAFLGVRIECAQCHKHPFDRWSKNDFDKFSKLFTTVRASQNGIGADAKEQRNELIKQVTDGKKLDNGELRRAIYRAAAQGETVPFGELFVVKQRTVNKTLLEKRKKLIAKAKQNGKKVAPLPIPSGHILGESTAVPLSTDPRPALMQWLRSETNPFFAKAIVNRVWANYFGIGIVDPTDDMNMANPPSNTPLLDFLAKQFIHQKFDLKWLHREIVLSATYQRSAEPNETNRHDRVNFARHVPRRLPAEVVYDAVVLATGSDDKASQLRNEVDQMAIAEGLAQNRNKRDFAMEVFGQSIRESNCDCDRSDSPSLLQAIYLRNDADMHRRLSSDDGWVAQACESLGVDAPSNRIDPKKVATLRAANGLRKQILTKVRQFNQIPKVRQANTMPKVQREYQRAKSKFNQFGFDIPPLKKLLTNPNSWQKVELAKQDSEKATMTIDAVIEEAYMRTLSRFPDREETAIATDYIDTSTSKSDAVQSLLWALVNTKEFIITH